jgi:ABC-type multidrug transport system ATPase subunit
VSDSVAILNDGEIIAQAPLEELLAGKDGTVYSIVLEGRPNNVQAKVMEQVWVSNVHKEAVNGRVTWQVGVTDERAAKSNLLRLILSDDTVDVLEFKPKKYELEEVFLSIVGDANNVHE